ncbi:MAG: ferrochelatase, partial [Coriobacteriia bacterium]|nr:ferrochelatase [Coriobacteriia bacterium]
SDVGDSKIAILTAHSLPVADLSDPDPYCEGLRFLAARLAHGLGMDPGSEFSDDARLPGVSAYGAMTGELPWVLAFQSKGQRECEWLGPELGDVLEAVAEAGIKGVVVQPIGFVTDHMETLYDLDVEAGGKAMELDLEFERGRVPNASPILVEGLLRVVVQALDLPTREPSSAVEGHLTS